MIYLAIAAGAICFGLSLMNWRFGFYGLLLYLPFAGMVSLLSGQSTAALLAKDIVFVIPAYISFFVLNASDLKKAFLPAAMLIAMLALVVLVVFQAANPNIPDPLVAAIGAKVWLLYMPLAVLASAAIDSDKELHRFLRINVILGLIPIAVGLLQLVGIQTIGAENTVEAIYGANSTVSDANLFGGLDYGETIYRINSTFSANGQYYIYTLVIITLAAGLAIGDPDRRWRLIATATLFAAITAAFLSGARGAAIFVPIALAPIMLLSGRIIELAALAVLVPVIYVLAMSANGIDIKLLLGDVGTFTVTYAQDYGVDRILEAMSDNPLGLGTGMNTSAARYAIGTTAQFAAIESYYIKAILELSTLALPAVLVVLWMPVVQSVKLVGIGSSKTIRGYGAGLAGFFVFVSLLSVRYWPLDVDPVNAYFWILAGLVFKLNWISRRVARDTDIVALRSLEPSSAFTTAGPD
jgi:hypothetical protein